MRSAGVKADREGCLAGPRACASRPLSVSFCPASCNNTPVKSRPVAVIKLSVEFDSTYMLSAATYMLSAIRRRSPPLFGSCMQRVGARMLCASSTGISAPLKPIDLTARVKQLNLRMTPREMAVVRRDGDANKDGILTADELRAIARGPMYDMAERRALLDVIAKEVDGLGGRLIVALDFTGTALFAVCGTITAGAAGMHVVGATLVGCAAAMGGGTLNDVMTHNTGRGGVFWMRDPRFLALSIACSLATFYCWPEYEEYAARAEFAELKAACIEHNWRKAEVYHASSADGEWERLSSDDFEAALNGAPGLARRVRLACGLAADASAADCFAALKPTDEGTIDKTKLRKLATAMVLESDVFYGIESAALAAIAIIGAQSGIKTGLPPLACVALGVTICSGGIIRDILCGRNVALGTQSFALATALGASTFVALRQLAVRGYHVPMPLRIVLASAAVLGQRFHVLQLRDQTGRDSSLSKMGQSNRSGSLGAAIYERTH